MHIGYGNMVPWWTVRAVMMPKSAPMKRLREEAKKGGRLCDCTMGRLTRAIIITDSNQVILSAVAPETLVPRLREAREKDRQKERGGKCPL